MVELFMLHKVPCVSGIGSGSEYGGVIASGSPTGSGSW